MNKKLDHRKIRQITFPHNLPLGSNEVPEMLSAMFELTNEPMVILNMLGKVVSINPAFKKELGYDLKELEGKSLGFMHSAMKNPKESYENFFNKINNDGHFKGKFWFRNSDHSLSVLNAEFTTIYNRRLKPLHFIGVLNKHEHKKGYDNLTNLMTASKFQERLDYVIEKVGRDCSLVSLIYFDIDNFTKINETFGAGKGDEILFRVSELLRKIKFEGDLLGRMGGDEFCYAALNTHTHNAIEKVVEKIFFNVCNSKLYEGIKLTISAGVSIYPLSGETSEMLITNAIQALGNAKKRGGGTVEFSHFLPDYELKRSENIIKNYDPKESHIVDLDSYFKKVV